MTQDMVKERLARAETDIEHYKERVDSLHEKVDQINEAVNKRAAFVTGVAAAISTIWAVVLGMVYMLKKIGG